MPRVNREAIQAAELAVIGGALSDRRNFNTLLRAGLDPDWFDSPTVRAAFERLLDLNHKGQTPDLILFTKNWDGAMADVERWIELGSMDPASYTRHLDVVRSKVMTQSVRKHLEKAVTELEVQPENLQDYVGRLVRTLYQNCGLGSTEKTIDSVVDLVVEDLREAKRSGGVGIPTPWPAYTEIHGPMLPGCTYVDAARPKCGKTAKQVAEAVYTAKELGLPVGMISLEMSFKQLVQRMAAHLSSVDGNVIRDQQATNEEKKQYWEALNLIRKLPIHIDDRPMYIEQLAGSMRWMVECRGCRVIYIDYLQKIRRRRGSGSETREQEVAYQMNTITVTAKELNVPVRLACQLGRPKPGQKTFRSHDIRESGAVEADADSITLINYQKENERHASQAMLSWTVDENRAQGTGELDVWWDKPTYTFNPTRKS